MSAPACRCGRRIIADRAGVVHTQCGTCRRQAEEQVHRLAQTQAQAAKRQGHCVECHEPITWTGRRAKLRCTRCRRNRQRQYDRPAGGRRHHAA